jgi:hypothetical protein
MTERPIANTDRKLTLEEKIMVLRVFLKATEPEEFHPVKDKNNTPERNVAEKQK